MDDSISIRKALGAFFQKEWPQQLLHILFTFFLPLFVTSPFWVKSSNGNIDLRSTFCQQRGFWIGFSVYLCLVIYFFYLNSKKSNVLKFQTLKSEFIMASQLLEGSIIKIYEEHSNVGVQKPVFDEAAQSACSVIYDMLTHSFPSSGIRVCVTKQIVNGTNRPLIKQVGYRTKTTLKSNMEKRPLSGYKKYVGEILRNNAEDYILFGEEGIKAHFHFKTHKVTDVMPKEYIAIPYKGRFEKICFVLQIDFTTPNIFGKNDCEKKVFVNEYIRPFVLRLANIYAYDKMILSQED